MRNQKRHRLPTKRGEIWIEIYPGYLISNYGRKARLFRSLFGVFQQYQ